MNYEEAKATKQFLNEQCDKHSKALQQFETNEHGLVSDEVRNSEEYKRANERYQESFQMLRFFNKYFLSTFKKEYMADKNNRFIKK